MPPRWLSLIIIVSWLGVTSWLVYTEVLPRWMPGSPPPFSIDLVEEAHTTRITTRWVAERGGEKTFTVNTHVERAGAGLFEMGAKYTPHGASRGKEEPVRVGNLLVSRMSSAYRINLAGDLLGLTVRVEGKREALGLALPFSADIEGDVRGGRMAPRLKMSLGGQELRLPLMEVEVPRGGGTTLMPLHPVNRIRGLRSGQRWTMHLFDPFPAVSQMGQGLGGPPVLRAVVRADTETFTHGRRQSVPCHVIDYTGDGVTATTWVAEKTGLVLKQEATQDGETWTLYRE